MADESFFTDDGVRNGGIGAAWVLRSAPGQYRTSMVVQRLSDPNEGEYTVIYDVDGGPETVWRVSPHSLPAQHDYCQITDAILTNRRVWFGGQGEAENPIRSYYIDPLLGSEASVTTPIQATPDNQAWAASDDLLAMQMVGGLSNRVYDRLDGVTYTVGDFTSNFVHVTLPQPSGQSAIFVQAADDIRWQGGIWTHATHAIEPLIVQRRRGRPSSRSARTARPSCGGRLPSRQSVTA